MDFRQSLHGYDGERPRKDLAEFKGEASGGSDPDLKKFADDTAKMVQGHLDLAKETQGKLK